jgi:thiamine-phosphate pyrophosphorylase
MADNLTVLRIIDANLNRATEALRVAEDHARFSLEDAFLSGQCKQLRHDLLSTVLAATSQRELLAARSTQTDIGTELTTQQESERESLRQCAAASWQRLHQALRVLEETLKLLSPIAADRIKKIRYQTYTLAKACLGTGRQRLAECRLYVLIDGAASEDVFAQRVRSLIRGGVHLLQLRDKRLADRELLARARIVRTLLDEEDRRHVDGNARRPLFVVNDRPDIAVLARADGVHVGQEELTVQEVRQIAGPDVLVGVSTHTLPQARQAVLDGADYLGCGPTFPSGTKQFDHFPGLEFLRAVAGEIALPAFAIGGITLENLPQVLATGIRRVAVAGALASADNLESALAAWHSALAG